MFFCQWNSSNLFSITRTSSFSVIHVSVNIKNNVKKDSTLLLFCSLEKLGRPCDISFQIKPWVAFVLPYLLVELFYIGVPVVQTDGRLCGGQTYSHVTTRISRMLRYQNQRNKKWSVLKTTSHVCLESQKIPLCVYSRRKKKKWSPPMWHLFEWPPGLFTIVFFLLLLWDLIIAMFVFWFYGMWLWDSFTGYVSEKRKVKAKWPFFSRLNSAEKH